MLLRQQMFKDVFIHLSLLLLLFQLCFQVKPGRHPGQDGRHDGNGRGQRRPRRGKEEEAGRAREDRTAADVADGGCKEIEWNKKFSD